MRCVGLRHAVAASRQVSVSSSTFKHSARTSQPALPGSWGRTTRRGTSASLSGCRSGAPVREGTGCNPAVVISTSSPTAPDRAGRKNSPSYPGCSLRPSLTSRQVYQPTIEVIDYDLDWPAHPGPFDNYTIAVDRRELWRRLASRPKNVRFDEVERLLVLSGWALERTRGSHKHYRKGTERLSVPFRRGTILIPYVRDVLRRTREEGDD
jgi:predicted RNA binding protein YcfA (HicA-like mRNA interferase family)